MKNARWLSPRHRRWCLGRKWLLLATRRGTTSCQAPKLVASVFASPLIISTISSLLKSSLTNGNPKTASVAAKTGAISGGDYAGRDLDCIHSGRGTMFRVSVISIGLLLALAMAAMRRFRNWTGLFLEFKGIGIETAQNKTQFKKARNPEMARQNKRQTRKYRIQNRILILWHATRKGVKLNVTLL